MFSGAEISCYEELNAWFYMSILYQFRNHSSSFFRPLRRNSKCQLNLLVKKKARLLGDAKMG